MVQLRRTKAGAPHRPDGSPIPQISSPDRDPLTGNAEGGGRGRPSAASTPEAPVPRPRNENEEQSSSSGGGPPDPPPPFNPNCRNKCEGMEALLREEQQRWEEERER